jgi:hypothetical protein
MTDSTVDPLPDFLRSREPRRLNDGDEPDRKPNPTGVMAATNLCLAFVLVANAILAGAQIRDHFRWGAAGIVMVWGPVVNCTLLIVFVALTPLVKSMGQGASVKWYVAVAVLLPLAFIPGQFVPVWLFDSPR